MCRDTFPAKIRALEPYSGRFDAFRLRAKTCDVLFATYPAGAVIAPHTHPTDNWGVVTKGRIVLIVAGKETGFEPGEWYHVPANTEHAARCEIDTEQIEFWFKPAPIPRHLRFGRARAFRGRSARRDPPSTASGTRRNGRDTA